jgi:hypothetical protein
MLGDKHMRLSTFGHLHREIIDVHLQSGIAGCELIYVALYRFYSGEECYRE